MRILSILLVFLSLSGLCAQSLTSEEVLNKAIAFHDPEQKWKSFKGTFNIRMETPNAADRYSTIQMDFPKRTFTLQVRQDGDSYGYFFEGDSCSTQLNGSTSISDEDRKAYRLTCERGKMMQNYYTYLYGLPMKLKDPGSNLDQKVQTKTFKGKEYLVLKVSYDEKVGDDVWYFYFDPKTYAMEVYQFYHDESKGDGEYILLKDLEEVSNIKMPKTRAWFYNKDNKYLGTDILTLPQE
ncbi:DUF6503 family protein [Flagellimonas flava]|uniref:Aspartyl-tRNA synthetase n=1 Tax=Flagellimonas flava TaxID=570519 RepID=A0A1M5MGU2_9FLAO|nr:DUF6503 family protein [Allomuricauda flava]SHG76352.1 hypothetical protein SAMN04488116_2437 [Allomuricauda flava]